MSPYMYSEFTFSAAFLLTNVTR